MWQIFISIWVVTSALAFIHLLLNKREPSAALAWIFFVIGAPIAGPVIYWIFGPQRLERKAIERSQEISEAVEQSAFSLEKFKESENATEANLGDAERRIFQLASRVSSYGATSGNHVELLIDPETALGRMHKAINEAKHFIHLEYYIIESDEVTDQLFDGLIAASKRGVEVRILYDAYGSLSLKKIFFRRLEKAGIRIKGFLPFSFVAFRLNLNFRNHRKILIIDGTLAFTGGTNIGKQYLGAHKDSHWRDYTVEVKGPAVRQLQDVFAKDWHFTTQEDIFHPQYYPTAKSSGDSFVQVLESGPDTQFQALYQTIFLTLNNARKEISLTTPYFIPDRSILTALNVAALQGTSVQIILPAKSDSRLVRYASSSFYEDLLETGVRIFEFQPRILHSKLLTVDGKWTILGSANMDIRSFQLNFELNLLVYGKSVAKQAKSLFLADLEQSEQITLEQHRSRPVAKRALENLCRLFSPIL